jgi:acyl-CoA thioester hydrolase
MRSHATRFDVQIYDLDAYGELRSSTVLRYLQQAASDASAAAGFDVEWYERSGTLWVIRRTIVEYLTPAVYRDAVEVRTWVADMRRVRSQRDYELWRTADETLLARASTDWVYVDLARGAPLQPPDAMRQQLLADVGAQPRPPRAARPVPAHAEQGTRRVEFADLDSVAHVNNAQYAVYVEQAVFDALAAHGWRIDPLQRAARLRVQRHDLEYFAEAQYDDRLDAAVWTAAPERSGFTSQCTLVRGTTRVLHAATRWAWSGDELPADLCAAASALSA